jgi:hypothetical protein
MSRTLARPASLSARGAGGTQGEDRAVQTADQPLRLPGGAPLAPGETSLVGDRFMYSTIAFHLHTEIVLTNRRLYVVRPNTLLGLIPVGTARSNFPIENIAGVSAGTRFDVASVLFGILGILFGLTALSAPNGALLGLVILLLGLVLILGAPKQAIEVMNSGGGVIRFPVSVFERGRTVEFANRVSEAVAGTTMRGGQTMAGPVPRGAGGGPSEALRHLQQLRDQGLVNENEYVAKRAEILARL